LLNKMNKIVLEVCSFSYDGCKIAQNSGADRIELCSNPSEGGTTPSYGLIRKVRENIPLKIYPLIRPRGGDFYYSPDEFDIILQDIKICKDLGCDGIATGIQDVNGKIDGERMKRVVDAAWPMGVTCIRAFDIVPGPYEAIENLIGIGCERILTSGMAQTAMEAANFINKLVRYAGNRIIIMPGSGIRADNIVLLVKTTGAIEFHTSARVFLPNKATWHSQSITEKDFGREVSCNPEEIKEIRRLADRAISELHS
jgi:copper homeostasis protein